MNNGLLIVFRKKVHSGVIQHLAAYLRFLLHLQLQVGQISRCSQMITTTRPPTLFSGANSVPFWAAMPLSEAMMRRAGSAIIFNIWGNRFHDEWFAGFVTITPLSNGLSTPSMADPSLKAREVFEQRMQHIRQHILNDWQSSETQRPDFYMIQHLHKLGRLDHSGYQYAMSYSELPATVRPCEVIENVNLPSRSGAITVNLENRRHSNLRMHRRRGRDFDAPAGRAGDNPGIQEQGDTRVVSKGGPAPVRNDFASTSSGPYSTNYENGDEEADGRCHNGDIQMSTQLNGKEVDKVIYSDGVGRGRSRVVAKPPDLNSVLRHSPSRVSLPLCPSETGSLGEESTFDSELFTISDATESIPEIDAQSPLHLATRTVTAHLVQCFYVQQQQLHGGTPQPADSVACFTPEDSSAGGQQTGSGASKRTRADEVEEKGKGRDDAGDDPRQTSEKRLRVPPSFACPFWKLRPFGNHQGCHRHRLSRVRDVKQHLTRKHTPAAYCQRCFQVFETAAGLYEHIQGVNCSHIPGSQLDA
ncbi:hypothetical protein QBC34DRAFT_212214 [Podospora aff. communis PSN243]|uniref:C2H2-type domain-containing protein n=1 Tax=Podospora aff. communis PSN243 TaxID=3040156 RepID=A0AAV9G486_9PEZI|nr:hypothetical protein QBC34DRAFT_212214 [Podospora aff. communis PSN243]